MFFIELYFSYYTDHAYFYKMGKNHFLIFSYFKFKQANLSIHLNFNFYHHCFIIRNEMTVYFNFIIINLTIITFQESLFLLSYSFKFTLSKHSRRSNYCYEII